MLCSMRASSVSTSECTTSHLPQHPYTALTRLPYIQTRIMPSCSWLWDAKQHRRPCSSRVGLHPSVVGIHQCVQYHHQVACSVRQGERLVFDALQAKRGRWTPMQGFDYLLLDLLETHSCYTLCMPGYQDYNALGSSANSMHISLQVIRWSPSLSGPLSAAHARLLMNGRGGGWTCGREVSP